MSSKQACRSYFGKSDLQTLVCITGEPQSIGLSSVMASNWGNTSRAAAAGPGSGTSLGRFNRFSGGKRPAMVGDRGHGPSPQPSADPGLASSQPAAPALLCMDDQQTGLSLISLAKVTHKSRGLGTGPQDRETRRLSTNRSSLSPRPLSSSLTIRTSPLTSDRASRCLASLALISSRSLTSLALVSSHSLVSLSLISLFRNWQVASNNPPKATSSPPKGMSISG